MKEDLCFRARTQHLGFDANGEVEAETSLLFDSEGA